MGRIRFILGIHAHQAVGNLPGVFAEAYRRSYALFLDVLSEFPQNPVALHYSGVLLGWLEAPHPELLERMVEVNGKQAADPSLFAVAETPAVGEVRIVDAWLGLATRLALDPPGTLWRCPVQTVSQSEAGYQRVAQQVALLPRWPPGGPKGVRELGLSLSIQSREAAGG